MKFLDIISEEISKPLDHLFYRKILNIISKKFNLKKTEKDLKTFSQTPTLKWNSLTTEFRNMWPLNIKSSEFNGPVRINGWLKETFELNERDIEYILYLLYRNIHVNNFLTDPLTIYDPMWETVIYYYEDQIGEGLEEHRWDCERCGGSGWEYEECNRCDGTGNITNVDGSAEECYECNSGEIQYDCRECGGDCVFTTEKMVAELWRNRMRVVSDKKIPEPKEGEIFISWFLKNCDKFTVLDMGNHDLDKIEIEEEGESTELDEVVGTVDMVRQFEINGEEDIKNFIQTFLYL